jgi:dTDP-4-amino-4,6-dideoxygalactose transaminase
VITELKQAGIGTSVHWMPLHMHPYYRESYDYKPSDFPVSAKLFQEIISLPIYPSMTEAEITRVCDVLKDIVGRNRRG